MLQGNGRFSNDGDLFHRAFLLGRVPTAATSIKLLAEQGATEESFWHSLPFSSPDAKNTPDTGRRNRHQSAFSASSCAIKERFGHAGVTPRMPTWPKCCSVVPALFPTAAADIDLPPWTVLAQPVFIAASVTVGGGCRRFRCGAPRRWPRAHI